MIGTGVSPIGLVGHPIWVDGKLIGVGVRLYARPGRYLGCLGCSSIAAGKPSICGENEVIGFGKVIEWKDETNLVLDQVHCYPSRWKSYT